VLVGINLLREGLDLPEVSLVAILDADKEGFLRSTRSLIQTIGRAARNLHGKAILYADRVTDSMKRAIDETDRRREKQRAFNELHNITPRSVIKPVHEMIDGVMTDTDGQKLGKDRLKASTFDSEGVIDLSMEDFKRKVKQLEEQMYQFARDLEFEQAALIRDEITQLKARHFGSGSKAA